MEGRLALDRHLHTNAGVEWTRRIPLQSPSKGLEKASLVSVRSTFLLYLTPPSPSSPYPTSSLMRLPSLSGHGFSQISSIFSICATLPSMAG